MSQPSEVSDQPASVAEAALVDAAPNTSTSSSSAAPVGEADAVIRLEKASVAYEIMRERIGTFKEVAVRMLQGKLRRPHEHFWALDAVDLTIRRGESLGVIGPNGAGKSTMLKLVARVLRPTLGRVWVRGRVAPLLELGAGFHPELTGRENVFLNGAVLGFSRRQMQAKLPRIVEFAELQDFIDAPLRTYSTGMSARLGFAIATDVEPDILVIDEILSVGDEAFRRKSEARMRAFRESGCTILFVSHALESVIDICQRAAWIEHGRLRAVGPSAEVVAAYRAEVGGA